MAAYNKRKTGYPTLGALAIDLMTELVNGGGTGATAADKKGMRLIFPDKLPTVADNLHPTTGYFQSDICHANIATGVATSVARYIFEATSNVDVITDVTQASPATFTFETTTLTKGWRICIEFPLVSTIAAIPASSTALPTVTIGTPVTSVQKGPIKVYKDFISIYVGTSVQLRNDGTVVALPELPVAVPSTTITFLEPSGLVGAGYRNATKGITDMAKAIIPPLTVAGLPGRGTAVTTATSGTPPVTTVTDTVLATPDWNVGFYNRIGVDQYSGYAVPLNYEITMSKRGIFFGIWDVLSESTGVKFNWVLVQRSVDRASGAIRGRPKTTEFGQDTYTSAVDTFVATTKNSVKPLWCVNCVNGFYYKFNPREEDIGAPSARTSAVFNTEDSTAMINPFDQQSLTDDSKYVITFLSNLNSNRFKYPDELDLVGTVSADVIGNGTEATVTVYGEPIDRVYRALPPNQPYGTGMRLVSFVKWTKTFAVTSSTMTKVGTDVFNEVSFTSWPTTPFTPISPFAVGSTITIEGYDVTRASLNGIFTVTSVVAPTGTPSVTKVKYRTTATAVIAAPATFTDITITGEIEGGPMSETP
jgi:hypothetical protein